ncbi:protachykinin isoform X1 [Carassius gibelio]|uniref:protachykinin isoform X1 n=1 Tax=Carassius gibelio TaxID=101364 RepID=UPI002277E632|nr:protachykinin isoform X1 [Carassius gibelio]
MEIWKLSAFMLTILALACSVQGLSFTLNRDHWISDNWEDEPVEETLASQVASLLKRSKSHPFYGLMGKRSKVFQPVKMERRRHKGDMFVGLMGKRSSGGMAFLCSTYTGDFRRTIPESSTAMDKSGDLNKQTDEREEWNRLQYY